MAHHSFSRRQALLALLAVPGFAAPAIVRAANDPNPAPRVMADEVKKAYEKGDAVIVDVRNKQAYDFEHAEGAISIPLDQFEKRVGELPKDKLIAAYCT
jgi:predicted sulfurtransferase